MRFRY